MLNADPFLRHLILNLISCGCTDYQCRSVHPYSQLSNLERFHQGKSSEVMIIREFF